LEFIKQTIQLRNCSLNLTAGNIEKKKFKVCLEYHLGNCKGPCEGLQTLEDYAGDISQLRNLLKGNLAPVIRHFKEEMKAHAADLAFEKAELVRKKIDYLENYQSRSVVAGLKAADLDVFYLLQEKEIAYVNYLMVRNGSIIQTQTNKVDTPLDETPEEVLAFSVAALRSTFNSDAREIVVPIPIDFPQEDMIVTVPRGGDKKKLLELAEKNARYFIDELQAKERLKLHSKEEAGKALLEQLQEELTLN
jgi:excinuclease ABC subunit C